ncbi:hypothetical protein VFPPC_18703 [Pochonia chlamydosporia 170]|uniref:Uncharacterized protein n=1 Tax=Pochonia chlamydosporia 170 TaxID=1380566 RepID=A0A219AS31_METCM|nr:hypothetical protein VFPPC_18703 [Pochonia chlamydosporia 170]OWT43570.1 hypothetical protein VFPPC_18703 [Pochonia chlamydosporia 170]
MLALSGPVSARIQTTFICTFPRYRLPKRDTKVPQGLRRGLLRLHGGKKGDKITTFLVADWPAVVLACALTSGQTRQRQRHRPVVAWENWRLGLWTKL